MSLAVGETHGNGISDELPTPEGLKVFGDHLKSRPLIAGRFSAAGAESLAHIEALFGGLENFTGKR
jgi:hypothetical protein